MIVLSEKIEELNISLTETTKRAEEAERQLIVLKSKASFSEKLVSHYDNIYGITKKCSDFKILLNAGHQSQNFSE